MNKTFQYLELIVGSLLYPVAINLFLVPAGLNSGGLIGFAQILSWLFMGSTAAIAGVINFCFNIPLFWLAYKNLSMGFIRKTVLSLVIQPVAMQSIPVAQTMILPDVISNALLAGVLGGLGVGLCLRSGGSAGGMDILGVYLSKVRRNFSVGKLSYALNAVILTWNGILFGMQSALYSLLFVMVCYFVSDRVHIQNIDVWALIITVNPNIKHEINEQMGRGVTWWNGNGAYTGRQQEILVTCINKYEVRQLSKLVKTLDPDAFVILNDGSPIRGNYEKRLV